MQRFPDTVDNLHDCPSVDIPDFEEYEEDLEVIIPIQGAKGAVGNRGMDGFIGDQGNKGHIGVRGEAGSDSENEGPNGSQGAPGEQGVEGEPGTDGERGVSGNKGSQGEQGVKGFMGETGPRGFQGPTGSLSNMSSITYSYFFMYIIVWIVLATILFFIVTFCVCSWIRRHKHYIPRLPTHKINRFPSVLTSDDLAPAWNRLKESSEITMTESNATEELDDILDQAEHYFDNSQLQCEDEDATPSGSIQIIVNDSQI